jgi:CheY-like chemotaxis protein
MKNAQSSFHESGEKKKTTIMVVDDEPVVRQTILEILQDEGFETFEMSDAAEALIWAQRLCPDILLSDIIMPGMNGIDMAIQLSVVLPQCRIILFSGHASAPGLLEKARAQGHEFEVFAKPINPNDLIPRLRGPKNLSSEQEAFPRQRTGWPPKKTAGK